MQNLNQYLTKIVSVKNGQSLRKLTWYENSKKFYFPQNNI